MSLMMSKGPANCSVPIQIIKHHPRLDFDLDFPPAGVEFTTIDGPLAGAISSDTVLHGDFDDDGIGDLGIGNPHDSPAGRQDGGSLMNPSH